MVREAWNEREKSVRGRQGWSEHAAQTERLPETRWGELEEGHREGPHAI